MLCLFCPKRGKLKDKTEEKTEVHNVIVYLFPDPRF